MKLEKIRKHRKFSRWIEGVLSANPVLVGGLALPFAVMVTNNLKNSVSVSIILACSLIPTVLLASLIGKYLPKWIAPMVYALVSMLLVIAAVPLILPISPEIVDSLGIYIPIIAVNTILSSLCARHARSSHSPALALADALSYSVGFALAMVLIACIREPLSNNTLWGVPFALPFKASGFQIGFSGFILAAFLAALFRFVKRMYRMLLYRHYNPLPEEQVEF